MIDLPGAYSLSPDSLDEAVTRDAVLGRLAGEPAPDVIVAVADATNLRLVLRLVRQRVGWGRTSWRCVQGLVFAHPSAKKCQPLASRLAMLQRCTSDGPS